MIFLYFEDYALGHEFLTNKQRKPQEAKTYSKNQKKNQRRKL